jgi:hypothetical protein
MMCPGIGDGITGVIVQPNIPFKEKREMRCKYIRDIIDKFGFI